MAKQLQLRRGTTAQHSTFTGAVGEVTIDTDKDVVVVHDGATAGGFPSQKQLVSGTNIKTVNSTTLLGSGDIAVQPTLVSGTNIKTINNSTILGSGNIDVVSAGMITGGTTNQVLAKNSNTDYDTKWYSVQDTLVSGTNIKTVNSTSLLGSGNVAVQATLVSGTNIKSINSSSILASGNLDLVAKVSSTDNAIVRFDGTSGAVQNSGVIIDDNNYITTRIFNQAGTEFNGVEYADSGILGTPDTSFSSTGARIYPDGTIRGKSSYGEYVKYPNGRLECNITIYGGVSSTLTSTGTQTYPCSFLGERSSYSFMQTTPHGDPNYGKSLVWRYYDDSSSAFGYMIAPDDGVGTFVASVSFTISVQGRWK